jgi:helicase SWR1
MAAEALDRMVAKDASLLNRIASFRKQGRLLPGTDIFSGAAGQKSPFTDPKPGPDPWDHVLAAVVTQSRIVRRTHGHQIASQIATKIQAYWDGHAAKKDKARLQEEKRLRALAKATMKMVTNEWKRAVFVSLIRDVVIPQLLTLLVLYSISGTRND